jgi:hypothetical protein
MPRLSEVFAFVGIQGHDGCGAGAIVKGLPKRRRRGQWHPLALCCRRYRNTAHPTARLAGDWVCPQSRRPDVPESLNGFFQSPNQLLRS